MDKHDKPTLLIKVGTATLTRGGDKISRAKLEDLAVQIIDLQKTYRVILVCSGAIAAAKQFMKLEKFGDHLVEKQALASIGQPFLMRLLHDSFRDYEIPVGQCLLSYPDFEREDSKQNITNTINVLLDHGIVPIINENDTTTTEEIRFGDNDKLSAHVAILLQVDRLILVTNTYGIYDDQQTTIAEVPDIDAVLRFIKKGFSTQGTGGMQTKLQAAKMAQEHGIETWIINGHDDGFLENVFEGRSAFSRVVA